MPRLLLISIALACLAAGCTHVAPYEREYLARPGMDRGKQEGRYHAFTAHVYESREGAGAVGVSDATGGGCGCN
ncbi:MAG: DUF4266 domain-containing protein [Myxococcales bacterium]|jgi:hypothetical protein